MVLLPGFYFSILNWSISLWQQDVEEVVQILSSSSLESTPTKREKGEQQKDR